VSEHPVRPLGPAEPVGDLPALHEEAGIQLRVLPNLWEFWDGVVASTLGFSGIRLRNAAPRPANRDGAAAPLLSANLPAAEKAAAAGPARRE
jgi:hypothetical protein